MIEAELPDGRILEFPDGTAPDVVQATVKKTLGVQSQPSTMETVGMAALKSAVPGGFLVHKGMELLDKSAYEGGGKVTDIASSAGASPETAAKLGFGTNVAIQALPTVLGGEVAKLGAPVMRSISERVMQSALKPPSKMLMPGYGGAPSAASKAGAMAIDERILANEGGAANVRTLLNKVEADKQQLLLDRALQGGAQVDKGAVASRLQDVRTRFAKQPRPEADLKLIDDAYADFIKSPSVPDKIPIGQAQEIKSGGGSILRKKYGTLGAADVEIDKALVRGFKEELEKAVPGIKEMNVREQNLINTLLLVDRRSAMTGNMNVGGLTFLAHNPGAAAAFMADRSSPFKSALALLIDANKRTVPQTAGNIAGGAAGAYSGQRQ